MALGSSWGSGLGGVGSVPILGTELGSPEACLSQEVPVTKGLPREPQKFCCLLRPREVSGHHDIHFGHRCGAFGGCRRQATPAPSPHRAGSLCLGCLGARRDPASSPFPETRTLIPAAGGPSAIGPSPPASRASREPQIWPQQSPNSGQRMSPAAPGPAVGSHCAQAFRDTGLLLEEFSGHP